MAAVAQAYVYEEGWDGHWRLDVIAIYARGKGQPAIEWYKNITG